MFLSDWHVLLRRWYLVVVGMLVTVGLALAAAATVPVTYIATEELVLLPPRASEGNDNPYLGLGGLESFAEVVARAMMDEEAARHMLSLGVSSRYGVEFDRTAGGPILIVTAEEETQAKTLSSLQIVTKQLPIVTKKLQNDSAVVQHAEITVATIGRKGQPEGQQKSQLRALIVVVVLGLSLTLLAVSFVDASIARRARRKVAPEEPGDADRDDDAPGAQLPTPPEPPDAPHPEADPASAYEVISAPSHLGDDESTAQTPTASQVPTASEAVTTQLLTHADLSTAESSTPQVQAAGSDALDDAPTRGFNLTELVERHSKATPTHAQRSSSPEQGGQ
jgi:hypothetical protein